jgi:DegV family protein with EDD domain
MVKILADSTCDLSPEILTKMDITLMPIIITVDEKAYRDGVDITSQDIFRYVEIEGKSCKTAAINSYEYAEFFKKFAGNYEAVIHINISSGFSSCHANAQIAASEFKNVYVVDSKNLSTGSGHVVYEAAEMAQAGMKAEDICAALEELTDRVEASFVIDRLDYLHKGGRCSGLEALGARFLKIKPCIEVVNGRMKVGKKYKGNFERCLELYIKDRLVGRDDIDNSRVFITHPACSPETVAKVRSAVETYGNFNQIIETRAGSTISCHCGPNTLGILFKRKK